MKANILHELKRLEQELQIKILYAVESGSRAWGFASTNSDWDVRFIYVHRKNWYLSLDEGKDNYEKILPSDIDLVGWDLKKALKLFRKSNPPLMEWLNSPIIYLEDTDFTQQLRQLVQDYFDPQTTMHHYLHMAEGNFREYLQKDQVRLKKYFYVLRPLLACSWIAEKRTMAPVEFEILLDTQITNPLLRKEIDLLLLRKKQGEELDLGPRVPLINQFIEEKINYYNQYLSQKETPPLLNSAPLNKLFRTTLKNKH